jgi:hypothetical protein
MYGLDTVIRSQRIALDISMLDRTRHPLPTKFRFKDYYHLYLAYCWDDNFKLFYQV